MTILISFFYSNSTYGFVLNQKKPIYTWFVLQWHDYYADHQGTEVPNPIPWTSSLLMGNMVQVERQHESYCGWRLWPQTPIWGTTRFPRKFPRKFPCSSRFSIAKKFHRFMSFTGRRPTSRRPRDEVMWAECCSDNEGDAPNGGKLDRRMLTAKGARANCTANVNITWLKFGGLSK